MAETGKKRAQSRRQRLCGAVVLLCVFLQMLAGTVAGAETEINTAESTEGSVLRIAVASDLHLDPDNTDKSQGNEVVYNMELVDALLWDAKQQGAEMLLLTGDLVNGGKPHRHEALTEKLRQAEREGLPVYVLPGNHDLAPVGQREFAAFYEEFGYAEAYSRDPGSLSYCIIRDRVMLLMMDTAGYSVSAIDLPGAAVRSSMDPFFSEETLQWAETCLQTAQERGLLVLAAGHYNLLPEISRQQGSGYCIENGDCFTKLLRTYGVPLYLSGHMHTRGVYQEEGLTELLTEYLLGYPTGYSLLDLSKNTLRYTPRRVNVDAWAAAMGQSDPVLRNFADWQQEGLFNYSVSNINYMTGRNPLTEEEKKDAVGFFYTAMNAFWSGTLSEQRERIETMPGYEPFFRCAEGYAYGWWLKELIRTASPLLKGFTLEIG